MEYKLTYEQYQQGLRGGKFLGLLCENCGAYTFPAQGVCRNCGGQKLNVAEMKGEGTLRTFTVVRVAPEGMKPPYIIAMVELDEGAWATGRVVDMNPDDADMSLIGKRVRFGTQAAERASDPENIPYFLTFRLL
ncbi:MAG: Zn-ribbon domain-containing OB-fold protein [Pseudomonadota bacterium]